jgi:hypothetical protein
VDEHLVFQPNAKKIAPLPETLLDLLAVHFRIFQRVITSCSHTFKREHFATLRPFFHRSFRTSGSQRDGTLVPLRGPCKPARSSFAFGAQVPLQLVDGFQSGVAPASSVVSRLTHRCVTDTTKIALRFSKDESSSNIGRFPEGWLESFNVCLATVCCCFPRLVVTKNGNFFQYGKFDASQK